MRRRQANLRERQQARRDRANARSEMAATRTPQEQLTRLVARGARGCQEFARIINDFNHINRPIVLNEEDFA